MKKGFTLACIAAFILLYEDLNHLIVILVVGGYEFGDAWTKAFRSSSIEGALLAGLFRAIPFIPLLLCGLFTKLLSHLRGMVSLWVGYAVSVIVVFIGYWSVTEPLYTDAHASSTSALGYIGVPIAALVYSSVACIVTYVAIYVYEVVLKRA